MEGSVLFLCTGGTIDKCYPRTQVGFYPDTMRTMVMMMRYEVCGRMRKMLAMKMIMMTMKVDQ